MDFMRELEQLSDDEFDHGGNGYLHSQRGAYQLPNVIDDSHEAPHGVNNGIYTIRSVDITSDRSEIQNDEYTNLTSNSSNLIHHSTEVNTPLISTSVLSDKARGIFKFRSFNKMQSSCFPAIYKGDNNCVISSPTGSGKTVLFELAIIRLLNTNVNHSNIKILYIAPTKALCIERQADWTSRFASFGLTVGTLTSDTSFIETEQVKRSNIIITTPEKWDLMTRKWNDYGTLFGMIKLLLIDEIHILRENRGATLEVVVTRMKKICSDIRIIALSATVPNIQDIAGWIKLNSASSLNSITLVFGEDYRQVKLDKVIYGYKQTSNDFVFDSFLNTKLVEVLHEHSNSKPVLVFCPTRNSTVSTAKYLSEHYNCMMNHSQPLNHISQKDLREISKTGVSFHHAGMSMEDRNAVERNFISGATKILCSTSTLAVGVNLPAYLVIIKGTKIWNNNQFEEYSELDVLQMMGRAGRPQFESEGKAVLMTSSQKQQHYENLVKGNEKLESTLHLNLYENFVSETHLRTITSLEDALVWLRNTFFYSRFKSNPTAYGEIPFHPNCSLDERLLKYCETKFKELLDYGVLEVVGGAFQSTPFGDAMTRHYISFETMKSVVKSSHGLSAADILLMVSKAHEFTTIRLKRNEKKLFKAINNSPILKYPLKSNDKGGKNIDASWEKIFLLVQYELGGLEYPSDPDFLKVQQPFKQDKFFVFKHIGRIVRCLVDCFNEKKDFISLRNCLMVYRSLSARGWEDSPMILRQLTSIGIAYVRKFVNHGVFDFNQIAKLDDNKIEYYLGLRPGQAFRIKSQVDSLPKLSIRSSYLKATKSRVQGIAVTAKVQVDITVSAKTSKWNGKSLTLNILSGLSTGELVDLRRAHISKISGSRTLIFDVPLNFTESTFECLISCEEIAGIGESSTLDIVQNLTNQLLSCLKTRSKSNEDQLEEDDDDLDDLLVQVSNKKTVQRDNLSEKRLAEDVPDDPLKCKHTCKDKTACRHLCCREGLAPKPIKRVKRPTKEQEEPTPKLKQSSLSGLDLLNKLHPASVGEVKRTDLSRFRFHPVIKDVGGSSIPKVVHVEVEDVDDSDDDSFDAIEMLNKGKHWSTKNQIKPSFPTADEKAAHNSLREGKLKERISDLQRERSFIEVTSESSADITDSSIANIYQNIEQATHEFHDGLEKEQKEAHLQYSSQERQGYYRENSEDEFDQDPDLDGIFGSDVEVI